MGGRFVHLEDVCTMWRMDRRVAWYISYINRYRGVVKIQHCWGNDWKSMRRANIKSRHMGMCSRELWESNTWKSSERNLETVGIGK